MELPELVQRELDGASVLARVSLGGDDVVVVTWARTVLYRADGLLSDESVASYAHDAERVELRSGRRKTTFRLGYVDREEEFTVPSKSADEVLVPLMEGLLRHAGVVEDGEAVRGAYRFSELTLVITDRRALKHVGATVWDPEYDEAPYAQLTGLGFEEGSVATEMAVEVDGYPQRFKIPNEHAGSVRRTLQEAVFEYHGVGSLAELEATVGDDEPDATADVLEKSGFTRLLDDRESEDAAGAAGAAGTEGTAGTVASTTEGGVDPAQDSDSASDSGSLDGLGTAAGTDAERATEAGINPDRELTDEVAALRETVERQGERLERQGELIRQLVEELRRGR